MNSVSLAALITAAGVLAAGLATFWQARRTTRGRIETSEATVLWQQSQAMMTMLTEQRDKAEAQRDRLIDSQAATVVPALTSISAGLDRIIGTLAAHTDTLARIEGRAREGATAGGPGERQDDRRASRASASEAPRA